MDHSFYDGHDELYQQAKLGEDRTTRAGCRCENVVFVTGRMPRSGKLQVLDYSQAKNQVFRPAGATRCSLHRFTSNLAGPTGTWVRLAAQNITSKNE